MSEVTLVLRKGFILCVSVSLLMVVIASGCSSEDDPQEKTVVVYTCLDQVYSEPILAEFEKLTGIKVKPVYDAEAAKTTGLVNRLIARRQDPDCDVLWNNEILQTERLAQMGLLTEYVSPQAKRFPEQYRDKKGRWIGFAARMRVIIYNKRLIPAAKVPKGLSDFTLPQWKGQAAIAKPFYGTTLTHMTVLNQNWGSQRLSQYLASVLGNDVAVCLGNATVRDMVVAGERAFGLTDTDDAYSAILDGKEVAVIVPDLSEGALMIPNTVALIANAPHSEEGKKLIDYLLSPEVERKLAAARSAQIPLATDLADVKTPWDTIGAREHLMKIDVGSAAATIPDLVELLQNAGMDQ